MQPGCYRLLALMWCWLPAECQNQPLSMTSMRKTFFFEQYTAAISAIDLNWMIHEEYWGYEGKNRLRYTLTLVSSRRQSAQTSPCTSCLLPWDDGTPACLMIRTWKFATEKQISWVRVKTEFGRWSFLFMISIPNWRWKCILSFLLFIWQYRSIFLVTATKILQQPICWCPTLLWKPLGWQNNVLLMSYILCGQCTHMP